MNFIKTRAAIAAIQELLASHDGSKALVAYDAKLAQSSASSSANSVSSSAGNGATATAPSVNRSCIPDTVLQALFDRIERAAEAFHIELLKEQDYIDHLIYSAGFFSQLNFWFRQIRSLNGGMLASDELYELEAETNALVLKTK